MLVRALLIGALCGCQGDPVASSLDSAVVDSAAVDSVTSDVGEIPAACALKGNLIVNGDFAMGASGWLTSSFKIEPIPGPCGKALRLTNLDAYSELNQHVTSAPLKKGTRYHLRAIFRNPGREVGQQPGVLARFFHHNAKGEEVYTQTLVVQALDNRDWHLVEIAVPLEQDEERLAIYTLSEEANGQTFDLGLVSLVTE